MSDTFCYLLGAGASCDVLPVTKKFPQKMKEFLKDYDKFRADPSKQKPSDPRISTDSLNYEPHFKKSMNWLITEAKHHTSVDTFAKMLYLTDDYEGLGRLKATLATYLIMAQAMYGIDLRYDGFFATILRLRPNPRSSGPFIPDHIRIVTWNYDVQLEKAFYPYTRDEGGSLRKRILFETVTDNPHIKRVNGFVGVRGHGKFPDYRNVALQPFSIDTVLIALDGYSTIIANAYAFDSDIRFAWERTHEEIKQDIVPAIEDTTILIDIGYSFPFFNREIDRILLSCMSKLKKIYIQVLRTEHDAIKDRLRSIVRDLREVVPIDDKKRFFIPYEL